MKEPAQEFAGWGIPVSLRQVMLALVLLLALLLLAAVAVHGYGLARLEEVLGRAEERLGPLDPLAYAPPALPAEDNVAVRLAEVQEMLDAIPLEEDAGELIRLPHRSTALWRPEDLDRMRSFLVPRAAALARARGIAGLEGADFGLQRDAETMAVDEVRELFTVERLLRLHALFAAAEEQPEIAVGSLAALGTLADACYGESTGLTFALGAITEMDQLAALRELLARGLPEPEVLAALEDTLPRRDVFDTLRHSLGFQVAARTFHFRRNGGPTPRWNTPLHWRLLGLVAGEWLAAEALEPLLPVASAGTVTLPELERAAGEATSFLSRAPFEGLSPGPAPSEHAYEVAVGRLLARQALAVARHGALHGEYPSQLDPLSREPVTGGAIVYRREEDGSALLAAPTAREALADSPGLSHSPLEWYLPPPS